MIPRDIISRSPMDRIGHGQVGSVEFEELGFDLDRLGSAAGSQLPASSERCDVAADIFTENNHQLEEYIAERKQPYYQGKPVELDGRHDCGDAEAVMQLQLLRSRPGTRPRKP
jgi:hypothetical protein